MGLKIGLKLSTGDEVIEVRNGGFAEVGVLDDGFGGKRVVKRIKDEVLAEVGDAVGAAFFHECQIWVRRLKNVPPGAHIAQAYFALQTLDDLGPALFMTYVDGPSLTTLMRQGRQSLTQTVRMGAHIALGLEYAHARDARHRDLKPSNILLSRDNEIQLIDWGLSMAQHASDNTVGVFDYWSPERRANPLLDDAKDDVHALGVILYECLVGRYPGERTGPVGLRADLTGAQPTAPSSLVDLVCRMLAPNRDERPTATEVSSALNATELHVDVNGREVERPYCKGCGFVAGQSASATCPICEGQLYERYASPPREGMVRVPPGVFVHGLSENQARQALMAAGMPTDNEQSLTTLTTSGPHSNVFVPGFDIDVTPVTNRDYAAFVEATNYPAPKDFLAAYATMPDHPVVEVNWRDALCYALWAHKRLPKPLEWEKAARGDEDTRTYPWGDTWEDTRCNHNRYPLTDYRTTSPVTAFVSGRSDGRSPYGVADMAGNVSEWISDSRQTQAKGRDREMRAVCGGGWSDPVAAFGAVSTQIPADIEYRSESVGFRCAADIVYEERPVSTDG